MNAPTNHQETTALAGGQELQVVQDLGGRDLVLQGQYFDRLERLGTLMSKASGAVPRHLLNNPGACFSVAMVATRANFDPFGVARKTWMGPDGALKYEAQLVIALINNSGLLQQRLRWEYFGPWENILGRFEWRETKKRDNQGNLLTDDKGNVKKYIARTWKDEDEAGIGVRCIATLKGESEPRVTELLMAQAVTRNSTLWVEDPKQQIAYLSGYRWGRLHTPEVIMGIYTPEEEFSSPVDMGPADVVQTQVPPELLARADAAASKGRAAYQEFWKSCTHLDRALLSEKTDHHERLKTKAAEADSRRTVDVRPTTTSAPSPTPAPTQAPAPAGENQASAPAAGGDVVITYARLVDRMKNAAAKKDQNLLDVEADWIRDLPEEQQRKDATALYEELSQEISEGATK